MPTEKVAKRASIWELLQEFFRSRALFMRIYHAYEGRVLQHAADKGVDRKELRLDASGVSALLDTRQLADLRDRHLFRLKDLSHELFRTDSTTDVFDRYVTDAYHEISILKEEHLKVDRFAPEYGELEEDEEVKVILDEVHELFPHKVHHVYALFQKAKGRLEQLLPAYGRDKVLIRSLYLFGQDILADVYEGGLEQFYGVLYPKLGAARGYYEVGKSFLASGFLDKARDALQRCIQIAEMRKGEKPGMEEVLKDARRMLQRADRVPATPP